MFRAFRIQAILAGVLCAQAGALSIDALPSALPPRGGLCLVIGAADDIAFALALVSAGPWVVQGLDRDAGAVARGRERLQAQGVYGRITLEHWPHDELPHGDARPRPRTASPARPRCGCTSPAAGRCA